MPVETTAAGAGLVGMGSMEITAAAHLGVADGLVAPGLIVTGSVLLFAVARGRTLDASLRAVAGAVVLAAGAAAWSGAPVRVTAAAGVLALGVGAGVWTAGRKRRRRAAVREGNREFLRHADAVPQDAAQAERTRFAAELHDVVGHRLTGVVVAVGAALRLDDASLRAAALQHATDAARAALEDLDALGRPLEPARRISDLDALAAAFPGVEYRRAAPTMTPDGIGLAYRVLREALTNAVRHASGASVRVRIFAAGNGLVVEVADDGGTAAGADLGAGSGLASLRRAVAEAGGHLDAGPHESGWRVRMTLPGATAGRADRRVRSRLRGAVGDVALAVLAFALPWGACLIPAGGPDVLAASAAAEGLLVVLLAAHAVPLVFRRRAPRAAALASSAVVLVWVGCERQGWTPAHGTDVLLWSWWADLTLVYAAAFKQRSRPVPVVVACAAGLALASDGVTHPGTAWIVFTVVALIPALTCWFLGSRAERRRDASARAWNELHQDVRERAASAARAERDRLLRGLHGTARAHVAATVTAAGNGDLDGVLARSRAAMAVMQELVTGLRAAPDGDDTPPPTLDGLRTLAARRRTAVRVTGPARPRSAALEVTAFRVVEALIEDETPVALHHTPDGLELVVGPRADPAPRSLLDRIDAAGGTFAAADDGTVRVWLPETDPAPSA